MDGPQDVPAIAFASAEAWRAWLDHHHTEARGVWLKIAKQGGDRASLTYDQALEAALCYGWIDGQKGRFDEHHWLQRFTPRRPRSKWSAANRERAEALVERGRMRPAGLREIERAKADGRWQAAYAGQRSAAVPEDLRLALDAKPDAAAFFATLDRANRYAILYRIADAKRPETRTRRIETFVEMLARHETVHPAKASAAATAADP